MPTPLSAVFLRRPLLDELRRALRIQGRRLTPPPRNSVSMRAATTGAAKGRAARRPSCRTFARSPCIVFEVRLEYDCERADVMLSGDDGPDGRRDESADASTAVSTTGRDAIIA